ncbi:unnamed protein product, partial [Dovyalis caffra]
VQMDGYAVSFRAPGTAFLSIYGELLKLDAVETGEKSHLDYRLLVSVCTTSIIRKPGAFSLPQKHILVVLMSE